MATVSEFLYKTIEAKYLQCVCDLHGYVMNTQYWELKLVQKLMTIILGTEHSNHKVGYHFSYYKQFLKNKNSSQKLLQTENKYHFYFASLFGEAMISFKPWNITCLKFAKIELSIFCFVGLFVFRKLTHTKERRLKASDAFKVQIISLLHCFSWSLWGMWIFDS